MTLIQKLKKNKAGFTLIELIVVIAILAILAAILVPAMISYLNTASAGKEESNLRSAYSSACAAYTQLAVEGAVDKTELMTLTTELIGGSSKLPAGFSIESDTAGITSVSMTCSESGTVKYDGANFSGGGTKHDHANAN